MSRNTNACAKESTLLLPSQAQDATAHKPVFGSNVSQLRSSILLNSKVAVSHDLGSSQAADSSRIPKTPVAISAPRTISSSLPQTSHNSFTPNLLNAGRTQSLFQAT